MQSGELMAPCTQCICVNDARVTTWYAVISVSFR